jgi:hypothetical protein
MVLEFNAFKSFRKGGIFMDVILLSAFIIEYRIL